MTRRRSIPAAIMFAVGLFALLAATVEWDASDESPGPRGPGLTFVQLSDLHCADRTENPPRRFLLDMHHKDLVRSFEWLRAAVADINANVSPDFVAITGDLADKGRDVESLRRAKTILDGLECPYYPVIGDHDSRKAFRAVFGDRLNYSFEAKGWRFIALDASTGAVGEAGLEFLKKQLAREPARKGWVLALHRPFDVGEIEQFLAGYCYNVNLLLKNPEAVWRIVERGRPNDLRAILSGHVHLNRSLDYRGAPQYITGSLVVAPHAYRIFREVDGELESELRSVSLEP